MKHAGLDVLLAEGGHVQFLCAASYSGKDQVIPFDLTESRFPFRAGARDNMSIGDRVYGATVGYDLKRMPMKVSGSDAWDSRRHLAQGSVTSICMGVVAAWQKKGRGHDSDSRVPATGTHKEHPLWAEWLEQSGTGM